MEKTRLRGEKEMAFKTTLVTGTWANGDTDVTAGSIAKAINDVCAAATSVSFVVLTRTRGDEMMAVIVWKNA